MKERPLSEILVELNPAEITIDAFGRVASADAGIAAALQEIQGRSNLRSEAGEPNGSQCYCGGGGGGGPIQSGCPL
ncbi:hypothetical protein KBX37_30905 [Micromonospora sp. U56]|uniref:hypothetical protein n=1 Tax=Micromonospora sp. U56 TaxID=2824900 RepID=UPI001B38798E|nr:hypothetical protein [Micromonospora sp. U56]MBQ0897424.1 hypothetical protein [Micromonospora sp. U56]